MFWGLIMEPNKRYTQTVEKPFHISQAAMDTSTGDSEVCQVMVVVDSKNFLICTLQKGKIIQVPLDLYFKTGDVISFLTNGKCNVHLTGYLDPDFEDQESDEEEEEEEEDEAPELVPAKNKRKIDGATEGAAAKKLKQEAKKIMKQAAAADSDEEDSSDDDDGEDQLKKLLGEDVDSDENDESFKINSTAEPDDSDEDSDEEIEEEAEEDSDEPSSAVDTSANDSKAEESQKLSKSQKRRLKKKQQQLLKEQPKVNGVEKTKKEKPEKAAKVAEAKQPEVKEKKEKKNLSGGVAIEDLKVGSGPLAKAGKVVQVYYEGRLKTNNKMFDNCLKGPGFKFRLGSKEVISGWDVGVAGMKVGGKRRIVCPPAMAYGAKGSPPVIPPNSTLVFEVELKNVK